MSVAIALFTRDLRVHDNPVLHLAGPIHDYEHAHDDLAADGSSRLSPYLHFGCVSPTEAVRAADRSTPGGEAFIRQLAWRDFHHQVLAARPDTATADYRTHHDRWRRDDAAAQAHFLDLLVDADVANNQLNWQWVAGTGTDTRPNRILNPLRQAQRYDPTGDYVRRYLPEFQDIPGPAVHQPWKLDSHHRARLDYPDPLIDLRDGADYFRTARDETGGKQ
jgi:deoxyribodipyrimidine photo-lyase